VTSKDPRDGYGDWHTAHEMGDALEHIGWRVSYVERKGDRWYSLPDDLDYLMVLVDLYDISKVPAGVTTIAWVRNWTERWVEHPWFPDYDVVLASSGISKGIIERRTPKRVDALFPIATNPERFSRTPLETAYEADYVFTGNFWGELRTVDSLEVAPAETFAVFGKGWENVPRAARYARGASPLRRDAKGLLLREAGHRRHGLPDPALRGGQLPGLRRARRGHAGRDQLPGRGAGALR
jgi:hypothetical protein